jgi:uncharacterized zinc-type alcohol dehydrogenase-like protein
MYDARAYSAANATSPLASTTIPRRELTEHDIQTEILFCGICHSDLHSVRNEWSEFMPTEYRIIPIQKINKAYERLLRSDVKYRFSIDMASLESEQPDE